MKGVCSVWSNRGRASDISLGCPIIMSGSESIHLGGETVGVAGLLERLRYTLSVD